MEDQMESTYGSDRDGLICGFEFSPGSAGRPIGLPQAVEWMSRSHDAGSPNFIWLHFNLTDVSAERWIGSHLRVPPEFHDALAQGSRTTRIEDASDHLIAVLNDVAYDFTFDPSEISTLWAAVSQGVVVTARRHPLQSVDRLRQAVREGSGFASSLGLLNHLMRDQGDVLVRIVREATSRVDDIEDNLLVGKLQSRRSDLGGLRRVLVRLQRLLAPEPGAMFRLLRQPPPWVAIADLDDLRQSTEEFSLVLRDMSALQERIKLLQEEIAAQVGEQTNRSVFTLTVVTVLALPINIIAGLLGMNVGGIPLADNPAGFPIIAAVVLTFTIVAGWLTFRKDKG
jgi:zinc transporter